MAYLIVQRIKDKEYPIIFIYCHSGAEQGPTSCWYSDRRSFNITLGFVTKYLKSVNMLPLPESLYQVKDLLNDEERLLRQTLSMPWESIPAELKTGLVQKVQTAYEKMTTKLRRKSKAR